MSFISRQKNGLLCRFSTVIDTVSDYNMTDEEYIEMCAQKAREEAQETLKHSLRPFEEVKASFVPTNMSRVQQNFKINGKRMTRNMKRFNTQTRFVPLKIDEDFNVGHIQSKDGKVKDFKTRKAVEKYCKENHCIYCEEKYIFYK